MDVRAAAGVIVAALGGFTLPACGAARTPAPAGSDAAIRALVREARPIGRGPRFALRPRGPVLGGCRASLGPRTAIHVEVFAADRVLLIPAGVGVRGPVRYRAGRIGVARCYGALVTLDPTGVALVRAGARLRLGALFTEWREPLSGTRLAGFAAAPGARVRVFVDGRRHAGDPRALTLTRHAEIVLEVGPRVPPHHAYTFPPGV